MARRRSPGGVISGSQALSLLALLALALFILIAPLVLGRPFTPGSAVAYLVTLLCAGACTGLLVLAWRARRR